VAETLYIDSVDVAQGIVTLSPSHPLAHAYPVGTEVAPQARFKWSRDNASFAVNAAFVSSSQTTTTVTVDSLGRDDSTSLREGDIVELTTRAAELGVAHGLLGHITSDPQTDNLTLVIDAVDPAIGADTDLVLRRWDGTGLVASDHVDLGQGLEVVLGGTDFRPGDYWWIVARSLDSSLQVLDAAPPDGIVHGRAPLAVLHWKGDFGGARLERDHVNCVPAFGSLTGLRADQVAFDSAGTTIDATNVQEAIVKVSGRDVWTGVTEISWTHGGEITPDVFADGLSVTFGKRIIKSSFTPKNFIVTLELPLSDGTTSFILGGVLNSDSQDDTEWLFTPNRLPPLNTFSGSRPINRTGKTICRVVLHGDTIIDKDGHPVDGNLFVDESGAPVLPSGDGVRGGDFASWFYVPVPDPPIVSDFQIVVEPYAFNGPPKTITARFSKPVVNVTPSTFTVLDNQGTPLGSGILTVDQQGTSATWTYSAPDQAVLNAPAVDFTATLVGTTGGINDGHGLLLDGAGTGTGEGTNFVRSFVIDSVLQSITLPATSAPGGIAITATVTLSGPAPIGGATIALAATGPVHIEYPTSVTIPAGQTTATFKFTPAAVTQDAPIAVTASYRSDEPLTAPMTVKPAVLKSIDGPKDPVHGGMQFSAQLTYTGPLAQNTQVTVTSTNETVVPAKVFLVEAGNSVYGALLNSNPVAVDTVVKLGTTDSTVQSGPITIKH
jgi:hypothetical protein